MSRSSGVKGFFPCCCLLECFTLHQSGGEGAPVVPAPRGLYLGVSEVSSQNLEVQK